MIRKDDELHCAEADLPPRIAAGFAAARRAPEPEPSEALVARILADARTHRPAPLPEPAPVAPQRPGLRERVALALRVLALGGMQTAALGVGLWLGVMQPGIAPELFDRLGLGAAADVALLPDHAGLAEFLDPESGG
jgi:hypothetical protein